MRLALLASVAVLGLGTGTASAQYPVAPYGSPYYGGGGLSFFSAGPSGSFGFNIARPVVPVVPSYGYGYGYRPYGTYYGGYGGGYGYHHHHHHHHGYRW